MSKGEKVSRRKYVYAGAGIVVVAAAAGAGYYATRKPVPTPTPTPKPTPAPKPKPTPTTPVPTKPELKGELVIWEMDTTPSGIDAWNDIATKMHEKHPGVTVEIVPMPLSEIHKKLPTTIEGGKGIPDIAQINGPRVYTYAAPGWLLPVDEYLDSIVLPQSKGKSLKEDLIGPILEYNLYEGHYYGIPSGQGCYDLYYRMDIFEEAGLEVPTTWEEFLEAGQALTDPKKGKYGGGGSSLRFWDLWLGGLHGQGLHGVTMDGDKYGVDFDNELGVETMQFIYDIYTKQMPPGAVAIDTTQVRNWFKEGTIASYHGPPQHGMSTVEEMGEDFPIRSACPLKGRKESTSKMGNTNFCLLKKSDANVPAAIEFVRMMLDLDYGYRLTLRELPVLKSTMEDSRFLAVKKPWMDGLLCCARTSRILPRTKFWGKVASEANVQCEAMVLDKKTPEQANKDLAAEVRKLHGIA